MDVPERYADRFDSATYEDDPPVGVALVNDGTEEWVAWIPERMWERILALGLAYGLHVLTLLRGRERTELNHPQTQSFLDELQLIGATVEDNLLAGHLQ